MSTPQLNPARERHWICARRLRERRRALGLTQREVVERLQDHGCGTTNRSLSAMENGRGLDLGLLPELATALECTITYLLGLSSNAAAWLPDDPSRTVPRQTVPQQDGKAVEPPRPAVPVRGRAGILGPDVPARNRLRPVPERARVP
jgi:transcriptional regulator with XRE-family HTH domain